MRSKGRRSNNLVLGLNLEKTGKNCPAYEMGRKWSKTSFDDFSISAKFPSRNFDRSDSHIFAVLQKGLASSRKAGIKFKKELCANPVTEA